MREGTAFAMLGSGGERGMTGTRRENLVSEWWVTGLKKVVMLMLGSISMCVDEP